MSNVSNNKSGQVWVFGNSKGGCRKTTTAFHVAVALANRGNRVVLLDADSKQQSANDLLAKRASYVEKTGEWKSRGEDQYSIDANIIADRVLKKK